MVIMDKKRYRELERILKGAASHRRIQIIDILDEQPDLSVFDIAENIFIDFRTASEHLRKLTIAGIVMKRNDASSVRHALTKRGKDILRFCRTLE
jgi:DNA-binding transcriptional ArsR family regulator